jgi:peptidyl-prolyl cis-trans isomerase D
MLDFLRRSSTSIFAWLILGLLAAAFGLSFGLPSDSLTFGPSPIVKVSGEKIGDEEYRFQFNLIRRVVRVPKDPRFQQLMGFKEEVLEAAVEREILAQAADDLGLAATTRDAEDLVANGHLIVMGETFDWLGDMAFDYQIFTNAHLRSLQVSENKYLELQRKEFLARTLRDLLASSVTVSDGELRTLYEARGNRLSLEYARYESREYAQRVDPSAEEIRAWIEDHGDALRLEYEAQGSRFSKLPEQVRLWVIEVPKGADEDSAAAARSTIEDAAAGLKRGEDFRTLARRTSKHDTAPTGGDFGWVSVGSGSGLDPGVDERLGTLEPDRPSDILEGEGSFFIIRVTGKRSGDVPAEDAFLELAEEAIKAARGKELARSAAEEDLSKLAAGQGKPEVFSVLGGVENLGIVEGGEDEATRPRAALRETGPFSKSDPIPGLGPMPDLVAAAWETEPGGPMLETLYEVGEDFVIAGLAEKMATTDEEFHEVRPQLYAEAVERKGASVTARWAARRCLEAKAKGAVVVNQDKVSRVITYDIPDQEQAPELKPYSVCDRVGNRGGLLRAGLLGGE